jgi:hypothetical protein
LIRYFGNALGKPIFGNSLLIFDTEGVVMSIFFGARVPSLKTVISVPGFDNYGVRLDKGIIFSCQVEDGSWLISPEEKLSKGFNKLTCDNFDFSRQFFFIAEEGKYSAREDTRIERLVRTSDFTKKFPDYRANLSLRSDNGAISSYQSEYPFEMLRVRSSIVSNSGLLTSQTGDNYLVLPSIIDEPIIQDFQCALIHKPSGETLTTFTACTNRVTVHKLDNKLLSCNCYLFAQEFPMVPIYLNISDGGLSFEHTHPPHDAFFGNSKAVLRDFKNGF